MTKKILIVCLIFGLLPICSCGSEQQVRVPNLDNIDVLVTGINCNITIYKDCSSWHILTLDLISKEEIKDIGIKINIQTPYKFSIAQKEIIEIPYYVFLNYQDIDWPKFRDLHINLLAHEDYPYLSENAQEFKDFHEYANTYDNSYKDFINRNSYQDYYYYEMYILFDVTKTVLDENESFKEITLQINGQEYNCDIGKVELDYTTSFSLNKSILETQSGAADR
jgi:hypothetical protein